MQIIMSNNHQNFGSRGSTVAQKQALETIIPNCSLVTQVFSYVSMPNPAMLRAALQAPQSFQHALLKGSSYPIIWY